MAALNIWEVMKMGKNGPDTLVVKMLGSFSLLYRGKSLVGQKAAESQFTYLMQMVLHYRNKGGVSRKAVEDVLFGDRDVEDRKHAFRSILYNARKRLEKEGCPRADYIIQKDGMLCWTEEIPVEEDADCFEALCLAAREEKSSEERLSLLLEACNAYTGEFLGMYAGLIWAATESRRYRTMFYRCVEEIVELLRDRQDYITMEKVGRRASKMAPFADWESVTMEALIGTGKYEEARQLYADTVQLYFEERGLKPSQRLMDSLNQLGEQFEHPYEVIDSVKEKLAEPMGRSGPYVCSWPVFQGLYQMVSRMSERNGWSVYLMLCTVVDSKGNPMREGPRLDELSSRLGEAILHSIRRSDMVNRYGKGQYLILLLNITLENCRVVQKRIDGMFLSGRQRTGVKYHVSDVTSER